MSGKGRRVIANAASSKSPEQVAARGVKGTKQNERYGDSPGFVVAECNILNIMKKNNNKSQNIHQLS